MNFQSVKKITFFIFKLALAFGIVWYLLFRDTGLLLEGLRGFDVRYLGLAALFYAAHLAVCAWRWQRLADMLGIDLGKFESFNLFKGVLEKISRDVISVLVRAQIPFRQSEEGKTPNLNVREQPARKKQDMSSMQTSRSELSTNSGEPKSNAPVHVEKKVGRNDPCPCGSGKKYKNCHGREA